MNGGTGQRAHLPAGRERRQRRPAIRCGCAPIRDAGPPLERIYPDALMPNARLTVDLGEAFPTLAGEQSA